MPDLKDARRSRPEARIPAFVLRSPDFAALVMRSAVAAHVWLLLASYARKDVAWCSQRRLAAQTGTHRRTMVDALALLVELGWVKRAKRYKADSPRERLADEFRLCLPAPLEEVRQKLNLRMAGKAVEGAIPYVREDDVFQYASETFTRMARVDQDTLGSVEFADLRRSGRALHQYLLLCVYAPSEERVSAARLATEAHTTVARVREALAVLADPTAPWIEVTRTKAANKGNRPNSYTVVQRLLTPSLAQVPKESAADVAAAEAAANVAPGSEVFGEGAPPEDLVAKLPGDLRRLVDGAYPDTTDPERWGSLWAMIRDEGYWPRPKKETPEETATKLIRQFHNLMRKVDTSAYSPTANEMTFVLDLFRAHGAETWPICQYCVKQLQKTRHPAGNVAAMRPFIAEAVSMLGLGEAVA